MTAPRSLFEQVIDWENLWLASRKAARGKRGTAATAAFELRLGDHLIALQRELADQSYRPGRYTHFFVCEPKRRRISAAPFRDRVVHHAVCNLIEPRFERSFIADSYANRIGKGTHRAVERFQRLAARFPYVLQGDIVQHFPAVDHAILLDILGRKLDDPRLMALIGRIIRSGEGVLDQEYRMVWYPGDDLLAACRPRGLPIGNLTSQFWSNCFLSPFDHFVKRQLRCPGYLRYVDDFALFAQHKQQLWEWKQAIVEYLARLRLSVHAGSCQVRPCASGSRWLGFVIFPDHRKLKARKARYASAQLGRRLDAWQRGEISFADFDASVQGWINHVRYADTWGLRRHVLAGLSARQRRNAAERRSDGSYVGGNRSAGPAGR